jgi:two-component system sensor histidine kinase TctE
MTPIADMRDVDLILDATAPAHLHGDPILLQNALRNLLDNALKYAPADSRIMVRVQTIPSLSVDVSDEGRGFRLGEIDMLADRFVRGSDSGGQIGSGLGLTIAKDVAAAHGGRLILTNTPRGGACATLQF